MIGEPPSARYPAVPVDPAEHAARFAREWKDVLETLVQERMRFLGIPKEKIGTPDLLFGIKHAAFHAHYPNAGAVSPDGRIIIGSGILNPQLMDSTGPEASRAWKAARVTDRLNAAIAHEHEEGKSGSHPDAVENAPETELPIGGRARKLLRTIRLDEQSIRRGGSNHSR
jgi:hypothetical protein